MILSRRGFIFSTATLVGGGALFGCGRSAITNPLRSELETGAIALTAFLIIQADNSLQIAIPRAEMGQGVTTTLATIVAEELDVSLQEVSVIHPPASALYANIEGVVDAAPFAPDDDSVMANGVRWAMRAFAKSLGMQMTGASSSARDMWEPLRQAGAYARAALLQEAAHRLKVPSEALTLSNKKVVFDEARFTFAELATGAAARSVEAQPKPASQWRLIGKSLPRIDTREKSQGKALYAIDTELPDMLYATMPLCAKARP